MNLKPAVGPPTLHICITKLKLDDLEYLKKQQPLIQNWTTN